MIEDIGCSAGEITSIWDSIPEEGGQELQEEEEDEEEQEGMNNQEPVQETGVEPQINNEGTSARSPTPGNQRRSRRIQERNN